VWWSGSWRVADDPTLDVAAELESLGYGALWASGGFDPGLSPIFGQLLASTTRVAVASGIVSMWTGAPVDVGAAVADLESRFPGRFLLGIGASHAPMVSDYTRPYSRMVDYLDALDALDTPAPLLAPEVAVVLETDAAAARALAREYASLYLALPNYTQNLRTFGFGDEDIDAGGSDRLIDAVIPWGNATTIAARIREHHDAGADHVCLQVISATGRNGFPLAEYRQLAGVLFGG
jgi:alkanesulfonate monooxygenase SsuD/methylene tetrahydromethanopterin reductase-like flavin-dependent oxidoreductase (luciferase family)